MNIKDSYNLSQLVSDWAVVEWTSITLPGSMSRATSAMTNEICIKKSLVSCENSHSLYPYSIVTCFSLLPLISPLDENTEQISISNSQMDLKKSLFIKCKISYSKCKHPCALCSWIAQYNRTDSNWKNYMNK